MEGLPCSGRGLCTTGECDKPGGLAVVGPRSLSGLTALSALRECQFSAPSNRGHFSGRRPKGDQKGAWVRTGRSEEATLGKAKAARELRPRLAPAWGSSGLLYVPLTSRETSLVSPFLSWTLSPVSFLYLPPSLAMSTPKLLALGSKVRPSLGAWGRRRQGTLSSCTGGSTGVAWPVFRGWTPIANQRENRH